MLREVFLFLATRASTFSAYFPPKNYEKDRTCVFPHRTNMKKTDNAYFASKTQDIKCVFLPNTYCSTTQNARQTLFGHYSYFSVVARIINQCLTCHKSTYWFHFHKILFPQKHFIFSYTKWQNRGPHFLGPHINDPESRASQLTTYTNEAIFVTSDTPDSSSVPDHTVWRYTTDGGDRVRFPGRDLSCCAVWRELVVMMLAAQEGETGLSSQARGRR